MNRLPMGLEINNVSIGRLYASSDKWHIYQASDNSYVLAAEKKLYNMWKDNFGLSHDFSPVKEYDNIYAIAESNFIISSLENGPFPTDREEILNFANAFGKFVKNYPDVSLYNGIYIEKWDIVLPDYAHSEELDNKTVFAKWITGGVEISIDNYKRVSELASYLTEDDVWNVSENAGLEIKTEEKKPRKKHKNTQGEEFSLPGRPDLEKFFNENIIDIVRNEEKYKKMGINFPGAIILYGPPGCGKTFAIDRLCDFLGWERYDINSGTIGSSYIHATGKKISEIFDNAIKNAPSVVVIDEMEAFLSDRSYGAESSTHHVEEVGEFLRKLPEATKNKVLVFAMTNMYENIDSAIKRKGRFDYHIEVGPASAENIESLLINKFRELPVAKDVIPMDIAKILEFRPLSDVTFVLKEAGRYAVKQDKDEIDKECIEAALDLLPKKKTENTMGFKK